MLKQPQYSSHLLVMPEALRDQQDKRIASEHDDVYPVASKVYELPLAYKPFRRRSEFLFSSELSCALQVNAAARCVFE
jgi:hypothetical protein